MYMIDLTCLAEISNPEGKTIYILLSRNFIL